MTSLIQMVARVHITPAAALATACGVSLAIGLAGLWLLWRVRKLLAVVADIQSRLATLTNSTSLLTDTTEACFKAVSMQLHFMQSLGSHAASRQTARPVPAAAAAVAAADRKPRSRRVPNASRHAEALAAIAASANAEPQPALRARPGRDAAGISEPRSPGRVLF